MKGPYSDNYKILIKQIVEHTRTHTLRSLMITEREIIIIKMFIQPKAIEIQCNAHQDTNDIIHRNRKKILN